MSALCRHFGTCGGCTFQDMPPEAYLRMKREQVGRALAAHGLGEVTVDLPAEVLPRTRRRASLKAAKHDGETKIGFHAARSHRIVDMRECRVLLPALADLISPLRDVLTLLLRDDEEAELLLTETDEGADIGFRFPRAPDARRVSALALWAGKQRVARISVNGETAFQFGTPSVRLGRAQVGLPSGSFLQPTREGEQFLQAAVCDGTKGASRIVDLFAGCGTLALALASRARVHAVDSDADGLAALFAAAQRTQKLKPVTVETRDLFKRPFSVKEIEGFEAAVLDPPRAGAMSQAKELAASGLVSIVYVSCNPESFARDAAILSGGGFRIGRVQPVDQFLWSSHIELVAFLSRH